ncbi:MAG TPA: hypothetical protein DCL48_08655, partial [Alphaproteobacteria bacterium]|nr:hypothetical protein [Alphaproteobacteria bacterium]
MRSQAVLGIWVLTIACAGFPAPVAAADLRKNNPASAQSPGQSMTAEATSGAAVIQFQGLNLERAEGGSSPEETVLRFKQPTDPKLAEDLAKILPGWIDYASTGYDSLLIRAKRKASYAVTETPDGFTLRLTWAVDANEVTRTNLQRLRFLIATRQPDKARGILNDLRRRSVEPDVLDRLEADILLTENDPAAALERLDALAMSDPDDKALLRARSDLRLRLRSHVEVNARHQSIKQGDRQSHLRIATESATSLRGRITAQIETVHLKDDVLLRTDGAAGKFDSTRSRIAIGFAQDQGAGREWRASLVAGPGTIGARAQYQWLLPQSHWRLR